VIEVMVYNLNTPGLNFCDTRKWPLIVDDESSIVFKNVDKSVAVSLLASMYIAVAVVGDALKRMFPAPGSAAVVVVLNV